MCKTRKLYACKTCSFPGKDRCHCFIKAMLTSRKRSFVDLPVTGSDSSEADSCSECSASADISSRPALWLAFCEAFTFLIVARAAEFAGPRKGLARMSSPYFQEIGYPCSLAGGCKMLAHTPTQSCLSSGTAPAQAWRQRTSSMSLPRFPSASAGLSLCSLGCLDVKRALAASGSGFGERARALAPLPTLCALAFA